MAKLVKKGSMSLEEKMARLLEIAAAAKELEAEQKALRAEVLEVVKEKEVGFIFNGWKFADRITKDWKEPAEIVEGRAAIEEKIKPLREALEAKLIPLRAVLDAKLEAWKAKHAEDKKAFEEKHTLYVTKEK